MPDIHQLIQEGEHQQLDFKYQISDSRKIARTISAFANTDGGRLLIGVKDNGAIVGVRSEEEMHMIEAAADFYTSPAVPIICNNVLVSGKHVLEVIVSPSQHRPHVVKEKDKTRIAYFRQADENFPISRVIEKYWRMKHQKPKPVTYGTNEEKLLTFLNKNPFITVKRLAGLARISFRQAEDLLATMLHWEVITWDFNGVYFMYSLL